MKILNSEIPGIEGSGKLRWLKPGQYPIVRSTDPVNKVLELDEPKQALLLEWQGKREDIGACWYALVEGDIVIAWEDQLAGVAK